MKRGRRGRSRRFIPSVNVEGRLVVQLLAVYFESQKES
jgi:hypothetical protein